MSQNIRKNRRMFGANELSNDDAELGAARDYCGKYYIYISENVGLMSKALGILVVQRGMEGFVWTRRKRERARRVI